MKVTILNGNPPTTSGATSPAGNPGFDTYLADLKTQLESQGAVVTQIDLRDLKLSYCIGCFGCWVKTPGVCSSADESCVMRRAVIHSDFTLWAAPLKMGFPTAQLKTAMDKSIPLLHPYFEVDRGEAHHRKRYPKYPRLGLLIAPEADTDSTDIEIVTSIISRTAVNMKSRLEFVFDTEKSIEAVAARITAPPEAYIPVKKGLAPLPGVRITPPKKLVLFNGSPRGRKGNTPIMLTQFGEGFTSVQGNTCEIYNLNRLRDTGHHAQVFADAEAVWLGFPLYTDSMPGMVKTFIEALEPLRGRMDNPALGFLVQSGFPEALHSRYVERYLQKLAARLNAPYLGTIIKGNGEGVRMMSDKQNTSLFTALQGHGRDLAETGRLDPERLKEVVGVERYNPLLVPFFKLFVRLPIASWYWDMQLKNNNAYEDRFAQPYAEVES